MICSINEVRSVLQKAATGTGYSTGLSEDIAAAGAWLCAHGLDGMGAALESMRTRPPGTICYAGTSDGLVIASTRVGICGPSTLDLLSSGIQPTVTLLECDAPLLLLGMAGVAAAAHDLEFRFRFPHDATAVVTTAGVAVNGLLPEGSDLVLSCRKSGRSADTAPQAAGVEVPADSWRKAAVLAARTYVPATESSRLKGAGAGLTDND